MVNIEALIQNISQKAKKIAETNIRLSKENTELNERLLLLQRSVDLQRETIKDIEEKNKLLKIAHSITKDEEERKALKQKINSVIREIDKSMSLLND